jgi:hypothetical protein
VLDSESCLRRHYDIDRSQVVSEGKPDDPTKLLTHSPSEDYLFQCPTCTDTCTCYLHKRRALEAGGTSADGGGSKAGGDLETSAKEAGVPARQLTDMKDDATMKAETRNGGEPKEKEPPTKKESPKKKESPTKKESPAKKAPSKRRQPKMPNEKTKPATKELQKEPATKEVKKLKEKKDSAGKKDGTKVPEKEKAHPPKGKKDTQKMTANDAGKLNPPPAGVEPLRPVLKKPEHVNVPNFEWINISHPLSVISGRL